MDLVGIIALALAIPLGILANLLTPLIKNWYALRSMVRTQRRIVILERQLEEIKSGDTTQEFFQALWSILIILMITCLAIGMFIVCSNPKLQENKVYEIGRSLSIIMIGYAGGAASAAARRITMMRNPIWKERLEHNIGSLKASLTK